MERRVTRIAIVQALFQIDLMEEKNLDRVIFEFIEERKSLIEFDDVPENLKNENYNEPEKDLKEDQGNQNVDLSSVLINEVMFKNIVSGAFENLQDIDEKISEFIAENWSYERVERVLKAIIRAAVYELLYIKTPDRVVFNEYIEVAKYFYGAKKDIGFVNGILNKINVNYNPKKNKNSAKI